MKNHIPGSDTLLADLRIERRKADDDNVNVRLATSLTCPLKRAVCEMNL